MMLPSASITASHYICQTLMTFAVYSFEFRGRSVLPAYLSLRPLFVVYIRLPSANLTAPRTTTCARP